MRYLLSYRSIIYAGTLLTGMTGLIYQVVWQKYLTFIVGSEARSVALVVAVFLAGLATGYRYWGKRSERATGRRRLLRVYGVIEVGIGLYAAAFPFYLELLRWIGYRGPAGLLPDLLLTVLTLALPTFLMGATIPLLVSVVPDNADEVHLCHAKIYGINTLGACLGAFGASFLLIPRAGLDGSLLLAAAVNLVVGAVFVVNPLRDAVAKDRPIEAIPNRFDAKTVYFYVFVTGTIALSLEVLFVRVLSLTIGPGPHNFAIVVGVFVLGLALGSLMLTGRLLSVTFLFRAITFLLIYLMVLFYSVPHWPYWLSNVRVSLRSIPSNYTVYLLAVTGFLLLLLLPLLVPLGSMLPLVYGMIPKSATDYGKKCGWMYFYNTLGTAFGAVALSYLLLYFVDLDLIFKLDVALLAALALYLFHREQRRRRMLVLGLLALLFLVGPRWDRASHYVGLFRLQEVNPFNFQGLFEKPSIAPGVSFFEDGPDATVTVVDYPRGSRLERPAPGNADSTPSIVPIMSKSLVINGKSDGDTLQDYSTITLAALLPYLHAPDRQDLQAAVVGLGTGITAGLLGRAEDVGSVTVVEIAATLVESAPVFDDANYELTSNPRVEIVAMDGFKYFSRLRDRLDIVVSATSPPWVQGVENLFTPEFYRLAREALTQDGVFLQWIPLYTMDGVLFRSILTNLQSVFPHMRLYRISRAEMGILAAKSPVLDEVRDRRFAEPSITSARAKMELNDIDLLELIVLFETQQLKFLSAEGDSKIHTLSRPSLSYASDRMRFLNRQIDWSRFVDVRLARLTAYTEKRGQAFRGLLQKYPNGLRCTEPTAGPQLFCEQFNRLKEAHQTYSLDPGRVPVQTRLQAYDQLRQQGVLAEDPEFLASTVQQLVESGLTDPASLGTSIDGLMQAYAKDGLWEQAAQGLSLLRSAGLIAQGQHDRMVRELQGGRQSRDAFVNRYRGG